MYEKMVNPQLVQYIKSEEAQGYSVQQLHDYLVQQGYQEEDVKEAISEVHQLQMAPKSAENISASNDKLKKESSAKSLIITVVVLVLIVAVALGSWMMGGPECGDGVLDDGETSDNCCLDAGCVGSQTCENNLCLEPSCGECQHVVDHECVDYPCCSDDECEGSATCTNHVCSDMECGACEYAEDYECKRYNCCSHSECDDGIESTTDICQNPSTVESKCTHNVFVEISEKAITVDVSADVPVAFKFGNKGHAISLGQVAAQTAELLITPDDIKLTQNVGEEGQVDFDSDGVVDIGLELVSATDESAMIKIRTLSFACVTDLDCKDDNANTKDTCVDPQTSSAHCEHELVLKKCGDLLCMMEAAASCYPSVADHSGNGISDDILRTESRAIKILGSKEGLCTYQETLESLSVELTEFAKAQMVNESFTQDEIDQQEQTAKISAKLEIGRVVTCDFEGENLTAMFEKWNVGNFSLTDMADYSKGCTTERPDVELVGECDYDSDCDDGYDNTDDVCVNRGTSSSYCVHEKK